MSLLPFILVTAVGAVLATPACARRRFAAIGLVGLLAAVVTAATIRRRSSCFDDAGLATTAFLQLFLLLAPSSGLVLAIIGWAFETRRDASA